MGSLVLLLELISISVLANPFSVFEKKFMHSVTAYRSAFYLPYGGETGYRTSELEAVGFRFEVSFNHADLNFTFQPGGMISFHVFREDNENTTLKLTLQRQGRSRTHTSSFLSVIPPQSHFNNSSSPSLSTAMVPLRNEDHLKYLREGRIWDEAVPYALYRFEDESDYSHPTVVIVGIPLVENLTHAPLSKPFLICSHFRGIETIPSGRTLGDFFSRFPARGSNEKIFSNEALIFDSFRDGKFFYLSDRGNSSLTSPLALKPATLTGQWQMGQNIPTQQLVEGRMMEILSQFFFSGDLMGMLPYEQTLLQSFVPRFLKLSPTFDRIESAFTTLTLTDITPFLNQSQLSEYLWLTLEKIREAVKGHVLTHVPRFEKLNFEGDFPIFEPRVYRGEGPPPATVVNANSSSSTLAAPITPALITPFTPVELTRREPLADLDFAPQMLSNPGRLDYQTRRLEEMLARATSYEQVIQISQGGPHTDEASEVCAKAIRRVLKKHKDKWKASQEENEHWK